MPTINVAAGMTTSFEDGTENGLPVDDDFDGRKRDAGGENGH